MNCKKCDAVNDGMAALHCTVCGHALSEVPEPAASTVGDGPEASTAARAMLPDAALEQCYKIIVGPNQQSYYLKHFNDLDWRRVGFASWNWAALFGGLNWWLYRKMWLYAGVAFAASALASFVIVRPGAANGWSAATITLISYLELIALYGIILPVCANGLYHRHCRVLIKRARANSPQTGRSAMAARGGTSWLGPALLQMAYGSLVLLSLLVGSPAVQERSERRAIAAGLALGNQATVSVGAFHDSHHAFPVNVDQAGFSASLVPWVRRIDIDARNGAVLVLMAAGPLRGKTLTFTPDVNVQGSLSWTCSSVDIPGNLLPPDCQGRAPERRAGR
jgi:hypothetical protein